jgi:GT2 family glycosyltransferase
MTASSQAPRFSILITSYRSLAFIEKCVGSVLRSTGPCFELLFLENGSPDPEIEFLEKTYPEDIRAGRLRLFRNDETRYFAGGIMTIAPQAKGEFVVLLNADAWVEPDWLQVLDDYLRASGFDGAQADVRVADHPEERESQGSTMDPLGFTVHIPEGQIPASGRIFGVRGAACAFRRSVFEEVGGLDTSFRMYFEETDLCWRVNLFGYRIGYAFGSIVYHVGGGSARKGFFDWNHFRFIRNRIVSLFKNYGTRRLVLLLPLHVALCALGSAGHLLRGRPRTAFAVACAVVAGVSRIPAAIGRRRAVQSRRRLSDRDLVEQGVVPAGFKYLGKR